MTFIRNTQIFVDTDILVSAYNKSGGEKHKIARTILVEVWKKGQGVISTQVLQELYINMTMRIRTPMEIDAALEIVNALLSWTVIDNDGSSIPEAVDIQSKYRLSFRDARIVQAAAKSGSKVLLTDRLKEGTKINGITVVDPFVSLY